MTAILFLGLILLSALLVDTRRRLAILERQMDEEQRRQNSARTNTTTRPPATIASPTPPVPASAPAPSVPTAPSPPVPPAPSPWQKPVITEEAAQASHNPETAAPPPSILSTDIQRHEPVAPEIAMARAPSPLSSSQETMGDTDEGDKASPATERVTPPDIPLSAPPKEAAPSHSPQPSRLSSFSFEDLFGRKLPIWAGGVTLLVAAVLLVKYSIDAGLLSYSVRVVLGLIFGALLLAGAETARRRDDIMQDPRISQSLAGAAIGSFYAAIFAASSLYGLIGPGTAFAGLSAVTGLAMLLAMRFGAPCAVLGLIGGLATPAIIESDAPNVPLLAGYIAIVVGSLTLLSRHQKWVWLGIGALTGGAGWSLLMLLTGTLGQLSMLSVGLLILLLGIALPVVITADRDAPMVRLIASLMAALQLALLVATGNFAPLSWGLYGLLSIAFLWLAGRTPMLRRVIAVPLLAALALLAFWPEPEAFLFGAVIAGLLLIYGGWALWHLWRIRGSLLEARAISALSLAGYALCHWHFYGGQPGQDTGFAMLAIGFALFPAIAAALGWANDQRRDDARFALLTSASGLLLVIAALLGLPGWSLPAAIAAIAALVLGIAIRARDKRLSASGLFFLAGAILALLSTGAIDRELARLVMAGPQPAPLQAMVRWGALTLTAIFFAWHHCRTDHGAGADKNTGTGKDTGHGKTIRRGAGLQILSALTGYGLIAQGVPAPWLAIIAAIALFLLCEAMRRTDRLFALPTAATVALIAALWALVPFARWLFSALSSLYGTPMLATSLPEPALALRQLGITALIAGVALWRLQGQLPRPAWMLGMGQAGILTMAAIHILYKQLFLISDEAAFVHHGLAERTVWQAILLVLALGCWKLLKQREAACAFIAAALAHNIVYSQLLHNPLWSEQAVGPWPVFNLLLPAFALAFAAPLLAVKMATDRAGDFRRPTDLLHMALILLFSFASLRQLFSGTLLVGAPIGPAENIGWSVLAISLAIAFLLWGIRQGLRDWRIASLVLMLLAVGKVFLFDVSGLEGLLRILSFLALGFSLIGIGWLYSRYLRPDGATATE